MTSYLACDLGAESGRLMLGTLASGKLSLEEIHRFANVPIKANGSLHWDLPRLFEELKVGLKKVAERRTPIASISADSWGLDYALFTPDGSLVSPTFHYRDPRTQLGVERTFARVNWKTIFAKTGIQFLPMNTIFQLAAESPERLQSAALLLGIGDAFNYMLSGVARAEESLASTFQLYNPRTRDWSAALLEKLGLPKRVFPQIVPSGTQLGSLRPQLVRETGIENLNVIASCSHDTGAAVAAVPAVQQNVLPRVPLAVDLETSSAPSQPTWAYLSSGTWSLLGVELSAPIINDTARELNFTNEIGYGGSVRLLKNIVGLWIVQECRRDWAKRGQEFDYGTLTRLAADAPAFVSLIHPSDPRFLSPDDMPGKIAAFCRESGQPVPGSPGATTRCVLESLALLYRRTLREIERLTEKKIERLHIVGGGSKNSLLNQFTANAAQIPVLAGPVEATALGNILVQAITLEHVASLVAGRVIVGQSFRMERVEPRDAAQWLAAGERFEKLGT